MDAGGAPREGAVVSLFLPSGQRCGQRVVATVASAQGGTVQLLADHPVAGQREVAVSAQWWAAGAVPQPAPWPPPELCITGAGSDGGTFELVPLSRVRGGPVWRRSDGVCIYTAPGGQWAVGRVAGAAPAAEALRTVRPHAGVMPHRIPEWTRGGPAGGSRVEVRCPPSAALVLPPALREDPPEPYRPSVPPGTGYAQLRLMEGRCPAPAAKRQYAAFAAAAAGGAGLAAGLQQRRQLAWHCYALRRACGAPPIQLAALSPEEAGATAGGVLALLAEDKRLGGTLEEWLEAAAADRARDEAAERQRLRHSPIAPAVLIASEPGDGDSLDSSLTGTPSGSDRNAQMQHAHPQEAEFVTETESTVMVQRTEESTDAVSEAYPAAPQPTPADTADPTPDITPQGSPTAPQSDAGEPSPMTPPPEAAAAPPATRKCRVLALLAPLLLVPFGVFFIASAVGYGLCETWSAVEYEAAWWHAARAAGSPFGGFGRLAGAAPAADLELRVAQALASAWSLSVMAAGCGVVVGAWYL